ncbi:MAG: hypothetical protein ACLQU2_23885 [Candidatus Binataceae bacterium]
MRDEDLQWGWELVDGKVRQLEFDLYSQERDWYLAIVGISLDDLDRWRAKGWVSFDARDLERLTESMMKEVVFIRNLAQSFLCDAQVDALLKELQKPYQYDPTRIAYSFAYGWVQPPLVLDERELDEFVQYHLRKWIDDKVRFGEVDVLKKLSSILFWAVEKARANSIKEPENE